MQRGCGSCTSNAQSLAAEAASNVPANVLTRDNPSPKPLRIGLRSRNGPLASASEVISMSVGILARRS